ncbi:MAG: hypothetical protein H6813_07100 [Phycisphaeraceae bacterium]|nr:hypothetical protein [Phycisphaeraceae bacterium]MCB9848703.1 hypothetical protein [Phycisphaeraceae bacterium]
MKGKRINPLERHGEKLFFLLMLVALMAVLVKQFATGGMTVKVGAKDNLTISQGYETIASQAERLDGQIKSNEVDAKAPKKAPDVIELVQSAIPTKPSETVSIVIGVPDSGVIRGGSDPTIEPGGDGPEYAMPRPVAPATPLVKRYSGALDPITVATTAGLEDIVGSQQPFDVHAVTVSTTFDASALRAALAADPDGSGPLQPIPGHWWRGQLVLVDVELWRQEVYADGSNGPEELIGSMPGRGSVRASLNDPDASMPQILKTAEDEARDIARPDFYSVIAGAVWSPAAPEVQKTPQEIEADSRRAEIAHIDEELEALQQNLNDLGKSPDERQSRRPGASGGFGDTVARGGGGRGGPVGGGRSGRNNAAAEAARRAKAARERQELAIRTKMDELQAQRNEIVAWLTEQGLPIEVVEKADPGLEMVAAPVGSLKDSDTLHVWANDCGAEPGATYRYRVRLVYGNPFFGRDNVIRESQRDELASPRVIRTAYSPWSEPVTMDQTSYYYLTRVSGQGSGIGGDSGRIVYAEVYTFFYGFWRKADVRLRPGDPIVGEFVLPELDTFEFPTPQEGTVDARNIARKPVDSTLVRSLGDIMLDVRPSARVNRDALKGGRDTEPDYEAVLLDAADRITIRDPSQDRASERRSQMKLSAEQAQTAVLAEPGQGGVANVKEDGEGPGGRDARPGGNRDERPTRGLGGRGGLGG